MNEEQAKALRAEFPEGEIGKLPRITCGDCRKAPGKACSSHEKGKCAACNNYITSAHIHLDYVGHAELTDRLLSVDPEWTWEPAAWSDDGSPMIGHHNGNLVMWGRLTIAEIDKLHADDQATLLAWIAEQGFGSLKRGTLLASEVDPILDEVAALAALREHDHGASGAVRPAAEPGDGADAGAVTGPASALPLGDPT